MRQIEKYKKEMLLSAYVQKLAEAETEADRMYYARQIEIEKEMTFGDCWHEKA